MIERAEDGSPPFFEPLGHPMTLDPWEARWSPYDAATYDAALSLLRPTDILLDIGAGDGRLARRAAERVARVIAVERDAALLAHIPAHPRLEPVHADARHWPFPGGVTVGLLLMRHCTHVALYERKLRAAGATRLLTNARFGLGVEEIDLRAPRRPLATLPGGWWGCRCGRAGFKPFADPAALTLNNESTMNEVARCPGCAPPGRKQKLVWSQY